MSVVIKDPKGREVVKINNNGRMAIARFPDMDEKFKVYIIDLYKEMTNENPQELKDFLDYKTEENEFCV